MKVVIAGSRSITSYETVCDAIDRSGFNITAVVSGAARGVDKLGEQWASTHNVAIVRMPADWKRHGKAAGPIRNQQMAVVADAAVIVWDGKSAGSSNMIDNMIKLGKPVYVVVYGADRANANT